MTGVIFFPWNLKSRLFIVMSPRIFSPQIRPILSSYFENAEASGFVCILFVFLILSSFYFLSVHLKQNSHEPLRKEKMMFLTLDGCCFPKTCLTIQQIQQTFFGNTYCFRLLLVLSWALLHSNLFHCHSSLQE